MRKPGALGALVAMCLMLGACSSAGGSPSGSVASVPSAGTSPMSPSPTASSTSSLATIGVPADDGARIVGVTTLSPRMRDLTIESPSVGTVTVRLLVPSTFAQQPDARFPALYLLHGGGGGYADWTTNTDVEALTAPTDLLVVMPDAATSGIDGWYADWETPAEVGKQAWETFHLTELPQLLEANFQAGPDRAVAGLSMGGYGAVVYAGRHPGMFKAVASFSGALDMKSETQHFDDPDYAARWGDPVIDAANWAAHDPMVLVPALRGTALYLSFGNGVPGPYDAGRTDTDELEAWVNAGNAGFVAALAAAGIPATVDSYGPGTHSWPYWERELHAAMPLILQAVGAPATSSSASPAP
jgi:diacylglycerol O-acyltransferase/trehalose O-mycolyltransferase